MMAVNLKILKLSSLYLGFKIWYDESMKTLSVKILSGIVIIFVISVGAWAGYQIYKKVSASSTLANLFTPGPLTGPLDSNRAKNLDSEKIIYWTNYYREQEGLPPLDQNSKLTQAAVVKAKDMFARQYFEHTSPTGKTAADLVIAEGYNYRIVGENLALGDFKDEKDLVDAWMASPGHRANILKKDYKDIGVSAILDEYQGRLTWISVQEFGKLAPNCALPDQNLKKEIDSLSSQLTSLSNQINKLKADGNSLINQGNDLINQGNKIYQQTHSRAQASYYWNKGENLQTLGRAKLNQADSLVNEYNSKKSELDSLIANYNSQVKSYNFCIS